MKIKVCLYLSIIISVIGLNFLFFNSETEKQNIINTANFDKLKSSFDLKKIELKNELITMSDNILQIEYSLNSDKIQSKSDLSENQDILINDEMSETLPEEYGRYFYIDSEDFQYYEEKGKLKVLNLMNSTFKKDKRIKSINIILEDSTIFIKDSNAYYYDNPKQLSWYLLAEKKQNIIHYLYNDNKISLIKAIKNFGVIKIEYDITVFQNYFNNNEYLCDLEGNIIYSINKNEISKKDPLKNLITDIKGNIKVSNNLVLNYEKFDNFNLYYSEKSDFKAANVFPLTFNLLMMNLSYLVIIILSAIQKPKKNNS